ncbi:unnamed protein product [Protopolystoma xenopodis]|uniref:Uncharacterized protein n=1 Tax=Protopolystoma xenopodis TaxID=117903 RepID=A0A3S5BL83_9PLAT|nr:unnamed protein product [Protopolystoma xenopodis]
MGVQSNAGSENSCHFLSIVSPGSAAPSQAASNFKIGAIFLKSNTLATSNNLHKHKQRQQRPQHSHLHRFLKFLPGYRRRTRQSCSQADVPLNDDLNKILDSLDAEAISALRAVDIQAPQKSPLASAEMAMLAGQSSLYSIEAQGEREDADPNQNRDIHQKGLEKRMEALELHANSSATASGLSSTSSVASSAGPPEGKNPNNSRQDLARTQTERESVIVALIDHQSLNNSISGTPKLGVSCLSENDPGVFAPSKVYSDDHFRAGLLWEACTKEKVVYCMQPSLIAAVEICEQRLERLNNRLTRLRIYDSSNANTTVATKCNNCIRHPVHMSKASIVSPIVPPSHLSGSQDDLPKVPYEPSYCLSECNTAASVRTPTLTNSKAITTVGSSSEPLSQTKLDVWQTAGLSNSDQQAKLLENRMPYFMGNAPVLPKDELSSISISCPPLSSFHSSVDTSHSSRAALETSCPLSSADGCSLVDPAPSTSKATISECRKTFVQLADNENALKTTLKLPTGATYSTIIPSSLGAPVPLKLGEHLEGQSDVVIEEKCATTSPDKLFGIAGYSICRRLSGVGDLQNNATLERLDDLRHRLDNLRWQLEVGLTKFFL